jgi:hypothetical protein
VIIINESDMQFGRYREEQVFQIEKSEQYTKKLRQKEVRCCEFILLRSNKLFFVEAKKTCPNQLTADSDDKIVDNFNDYICKITEKMRHSLELYSNILLERYSQQGVPEQMKSISEKEICLVLVIKNAKLDWLISLRDKIAKELRKEMQIWKIPSFCVLNEEQARKKHFII